MLSEARRALFNRESVVEILVNSVILNDGYSAAVSTNGTRDGRVVRGAVGARRSTSGSATLVGVVRGRSGCWGVGYRTLEVRVHLEFCA